MAAGLFKDFFVRRALVALQFLQGLFEFLVGFVPLVDAGDEILPVRLATHNEVGAARVVQLRAGTVSAVLQIHREGLQVFLFQVSHFHGLLLLLQDHLAVCVLPFHLLDFGLDGWRGKKKIKIKLSQFFSFFSFTKSYMLGKEGVIDRQKPEATFTELPDAPVIF